MNKTHDVAQTFINFLLNIIPEAGRAMKVEEPWHHVSGYVSWLYRVPHLKILSPIEGEPLRPTNQEIII